MPSKKPDLEAIIIALLVINILFVALISFATLGEYAKRIKSSGVVVDRIAEGSDFFGATEQTGSLYVTSTPLGDLYVDYEFRGSTPVTIYDLAAGTHMVEIIKEGYADYVANVQIAAGELTVIDVVLVQLGTLNITSDPTGADVFADGALIGNTPLSFTIAPRDFSLRITKAYFDAYETIATVNSGQTTSVHAFLNLVNGIVVRSEPDNALVTVNGFAGTTPAMVGLPAGEYMVEVSKEGYSAYSALVEVFDQKVTELEVKLMLQGNLSVTTEPTGAFLFVDGFFWGTTPITVHDLDPTNHSVNISKAGYSDHIAEVEVPSGQTAFLNVTLNPRRNLSVSSTPAGAFLYMDDIFKGITPVIVSGLDAGLHSIMLTKLTYADHSGTVDVKDGVAQFYTSLVPGAQPLNFPETRVTNAFSSQTLPETNGKSIVWGSCSIRFCFEGDILLYDLQSGRTFPLKVAPGDQSLPRIADTRIVWRNFDAFTLYDIWLYELGPDGRYGTGDCYPQGRCEGEYQLTKNPRNQVQPAVSGDYVIWLDDRDGRWDIFLLDLFTNEERKIVPNLVESWLPNMAMDGKLVVWDDYRHGNAEIYLYDIGNPELGEQRITNLPGDQVDPEISGTVIVWADIINGLSESDIYMYELGPDGVYGTGDCYPQGRCEGQYLVTGAPDLQLRPAISGNFIVWYDLRERRLKGPDIYIFDIATGREYKVADTPYLDATPDVYGNTIVWVSFRVGSAQDIFFATLDPIPPAPSGLQATSGASVRLSWKGDEEPDFNNYAIYRGTTPGGPYRLVGTTVGPVDFIDTSVIDGVTYYYRVTSMDIAGGESAYSNEVEAKKTSSKTSSGSKPPVVRR
ncbi:MAG: PEGA domain-containing protein [Candidatus Aenigmarchaeota archaeon]|nr:PEGA domain-containing protein [Candidatus Aenigmarchaeota archaeon]